MDIPFSEFENIINDKGEFIPCLTCPVYFYTGICHDATTTCSLDHGQFKPLVGIPINKSVTLGFARDIIVAEYFCSTTDVSFHSVRIERCCFTEKKRLIRI
jgi:hypothetical protein